MLPEPLALLGQTADTSVRHPEGETDRPGTNSFFTEAAHFCQLLLVAAHRVQGKAASPPGLTARDADGALACHNNQP